MMIIGVIQTEADTKTVWDYSAVLYPEGIYDSNNLFLFNAQQIETVFFMDYRDPEGIQLLERMKKVGEADQGKAI